MTSFYKKLQDPNAFPCDNIPDEKLSYREREKKRMRKAMRERESNCGSFINSPDSTNPWQPENETWRG